MSGALVATLARARDLLRQADGGPGPPREVGLTLLVAWTGGSREEAEAAVARGRWWDAGAAPPELAAVLDALLGADRAPDRLRALRLAEAGLVAAARPAAPEPAPETPPPPRAPRVDLSVRGALDRPLAGGAFALLRAALAMAFGGLGVVGALLALVTVGALLSVEPAELASRPRGPLLEALVMPPLMLLGAWLAWRGMARLVRYGDLRHVGPPALSVGLILVIVLRWVYR